MKYKFSLYGFLKNQKFFEPFFLLFMINQGFSFFEIGFLLAYREVLINLFEVPSGAIADLFGRRKAMMFSFLNYIVSFVIFYFSRTYFNFYIALLFFAAGEAFRTGTHKAIIADYLEINDRQNELNSYYGFTRSWSKIGSAVSMVIAAFLAIYYKDYRTVFLFSIIPYLLGMINFLYYPAFLDDVNEKASLHTTIQHLKNSFITVYKNKTLSYLIIINSVYEGLYKLIKDYIQPIIKFSIISIPLLMYLDDFKRTTILITSIYVVIHLISAFGSIISDKVRKYLNSKGKSTFIILLLISILILSLIFITLKFKYLGFAIILFIFYNLIENIWKPVIVSEISLQCENKNKATILSIENQGQTLAKVILAPLLGFIADYSISYVMVTAGIILCIVIIFAYYFKDSTKF